MPQNHVYRDNNYIIIYLYKKIKLLSHDNKCICS